ncbi:MAG: hypothetical protein ACO3NA_06950 [Flavobacteriaceae bacterium]
MKTRIFTLVVLILFAYTLRGQQIQVNSDQLERVRQTPKELVWLTLNKTTFFPSEYLYFNGYLLKAKNRETSKVSQSIYIRLVSADQKYSEIKRVSLSDGFGSGDWFISSELATGSYTLQAYSQWMLNWPESIFEQEIHVINPYTNAKVSVKEPNIIKPSATGSSNRLFEIDLKASYTARDSVALSIRLTEEGRLISLPLSVSVRKVGELNEPPVNLQIAKIDKLRLGDKIYKPEHRGSNLRIELNQDYINPETAIITQQGTNQLFTKMVKEGSTYSTTVENLTTDYPVVLQEDSKVSLVDLVTFEPLPKANKKPLASTYKQLNEDQKSTLLQRSIYNQIENNYFEFRPDSIIVKPVKDFLSNLPSKEYNLNEYNRFRSLKETIREIIPEVSVNTYKGKETVAVKQIQVLPGYLPALLMIDGIQFTTSEDLFKVDATLIDYIRIYTDPVVYGGKTYAGALLMDGNSSQAGYFKTGALIPKSLLSESPKKYYNQTHLADPNLPDFRTQLFWNPRMRINSNKTIHLTTSEVKGTYVVQIQGLDKNGQPFYEMKSFSVN